MPANKQPLSEILLGDCRDLLEHDLIDFIDELGPVLSEEVLGLFDATRDEGKKAEYLRLRTDLQNRWESLTTACREELGRQLQHVKTVSDSPQGAPKLSELQFVSDKELAEQILMREFVGRITEACSEEIYALDRRIACLIGRDELDEGDNRLGPSSVCAAVRVGCEAMYPELAQQSLLLRQMERHLQLELPQLYRAINEVLIEADILPKLKRSYRPMVPSASASEAVDAANVMGTIQRLAQAMARGAGRAEIGGRGGVGSVSGGGSGAASPGGGIGAGDGRSAMAGSGDQTPVPSLLDAGGDALFQSLQAMPSSPDAGELTNVVRLARKSDAARQILPLEAITLDIVAMLFDLIFDDEKVPTAIKGLISRLQIPVLKLAIRDQQFFTDRSHPARRFLDSISGISIRWGKAVDEGDPFYVKLSELVERIQKGFDQDREVFGAAITELAAFVTENEAREVETSRVVAEIVQRKEDELRLQREQQATARQAANSALAPLLEKPLPAAIEHFLLGHWRDVMQSRAMQAGPDGAAFVEAGAIAAELVASIAPKKDAELRKNQVASLPKLLAGLNQGLDQISTVPEDRRSFMDALVELQLSALRGERPPKKPVPVVKAAPVEPTPPAAPVIELQVTHTVEHGVRIEQVTLPDRDTESDASATQDRATLRSVKHLVRGDWVEFVEAEGQVRRERLTWISPKRSLFLFSNSNAKRAISITPEALAHRLHIETARLVGRDAPMFERALDDAIKAIDQAAAV